MWRRHLSGFHLNNGSPLSSTHGWTLCRMGFCANRASRCGSSWLWSSSSGSSAICLLVLISKANAHRGHTGHSLTLLFGSTIPTTTTIVEQREYTYSTDILDDLTTRTGRPHSLCAVCMTISTRAVLSWPKQGGRHISFHPEQCHANRALEGSDRRHVYLSV